MNENDGADHLSVGMRLPSGGYDRPVAGRNLFWMQPGEN